MSALQQPTKPNRSVELSNYTTGRWYPLGEAERLAEADLGWPAEAERLAEADRATKQSSCRPTEQLSARRAAPPANSVKDQ